MWRFALILLPLPALADSVVATRTIRAHVALSADDMTMVAMDIPGALSDSATAVGQETRVIVYAGKPIHAEDLGPTAIIERNQIIPLSYSVGALSILTEGRALGRGELRPHGQARRCLRVDGLGAILVGGIGRIDHGQAGAARERFAAMPNFSPSRTVCSETASGATTSTSPGTWRAHSNCIAVLPSPVSANTAQRPLRSAQRTMAFWKSNK